MVVRPMSEHGKIVLDQTCGLTSLRDRRSIRNSQFHFLYFLELVCSFPDTVRIRKGHYWIFAVYYTRIYNGQSWFSNNMHHIIDG